MTNYTADPTPITPPRVPIIDARTGLIDRAWYLFFLSLFRNAVATDLVLLGPSTQDQTGQFDITEQTAQLAAQMNATQAEVSALQTLVQDLALGPANTPQVSQKRYGQFYDTTTQTAAVINTAYAMKFNTTDLSVGVYIGSPTSRVYVDRAGVYDIQFSAQLDNTSGGNHTATIWLRVNGVDVPYSAGRVVLKSTDGDLVAAWNYLYNFKDGDYFELMWSATDTAVQIAAAGAIAPAPETPSIILTVTDSISNGQ